MSGIPNTFAGRRVLVVDDEPSILKILSFKLRLGASSYVTKPFSTKVLVQEIEKALGRGVRPPQ